MDIDGVLADFVTPFLRLLERRFGGGPFDPAEITDPNLMRDTYDINQVACDWLRQHGIEDPVVHFTQEQKSQWVNHLEIELFADDRPENCEEVATQTEAIFMMPHRTYNRAFEHPKIHRIQDLNQMFAYLANKPETTRGELQFGNHR